MTLGYQEEGENFWRAQQLTKDHKPECHLEKARIMNSGGKVINKSGVPRVVWNRPRIGHKGPVTRSTPIDEIPFLAVARSLGDLWSYNSTLNEFVVSPDPDVEIVDIDSKKFRCLIFGTDGLWNVFSARQAVEHVQKAEEENQMSWKWTNPSKYLVDNALKTWNNTKLRADNITVVTILVYPPGPPSVQTIRQHEINMQCSNQNRPTFNCNPLDELLPSISADESYHSSIAVMTRPDRNNYDLGYMNSFAESYNSLYEHSQQNDSYIMQHQTKIHSEYSQQHHYHHQHSDDSETYSLTKLQTRSEQILSECDVSNVESSNEDQKIENHQFNHNPHNLSLEFHNFYSKESQEPSSSEYLYQIDNTIAPERSLITLGSDSSNTNDHYGVEIEKLCETNVESDLSFNDSIQINEVSSSSPTEFGPQCNKSTVNSNDTIIITTQPNHKTSSIIPPSRVIVTRSKDCPIISSLSTRTRSKTKCIAIQTRRPIKKSLVLKALPSIAFLHQQTQERRLSQRISQSITASTSISQQFQQSVLIPKKLISKTNTPREVKILKKLPTSMSLSASSKKGRACKATQATATTKTTLWPSRIST